MLENLDKEIKANQGWISFENFFDFVMYKPGLGYYSPGAKKLGASEILPPLPKFLGYLEKQFPIKS
ncbi:MAG: hypothetical protein Ct9H300mP6_07050 [Gammaproteobacteria bacterium]|nr:MAG: hypothetical protein Ct9H300mP6_07050 [Gammaproteobacteria bacterium]